MHTHIIRIHIHVYYEHRPGLQSSNPTWLSACWRADYKTPKGSNARCCRQFGNMAKDDHMITTGGELVGVIGLMDDGPPFRLTTVVSYGRFKPVVSGPFIHCFLI